jgi:hypothetical protein
MNRTDIAQLFAVASTIDHIERTESDVDGWHLILSDVDRNDAMAALKAHFADPVAGREFLKPAHITAKIAAAAPSVELPARDAATCELHDYPLNADGTCDGCRKWPEDLEPGAPAPHRIDFVKELQHDPRVSTGKPYPRDDVL